MYWGTDAVVIDLLSVPFAYQAELVDVQLNLYHT